MAHWVPSEQVFIVIYYFIKYNYNKSMRFVFDPDKDAANRKKHGVSLEEASGIDWESASVWSDTRRAMASHDNVPWEQ